MINKRLLIKNLLAYHDECSFYDKKRKLNLHTKEGKAKFLKHICALSNANPKNNSYIIVGVEDEQNELVGTDFFDDSKIQNLVNAYLENPPKILYENIPFPNLSKDQVVGLVTIKAKSNVSEFKKTIHTITKGSVYYREGSISMPMEHKMPYNKSNIEIVQQIENNSRNSIRFTLESVLEFITQKNKDLNPKHKVFRELFVVCWAGKTKKIRGQVFLSRVSIEMINEQISLFYSAMDLVTIEYNQEQFIITEYLPLGINDLTSLYPFEKKIIHFYDTGYYKIETEFLFQPPKYNLKMLHHIYNHMLQLITGLQKNIPLDIRQQKDLITMPYMMIICYWNGFDKAIEKLIEIKDLLKAYQDPKLFVNFKEVMRLLRKMKYDKE